MIYFDNSATTFPKPSSVTKATARSIETCTNPGRAAHTLSMNAAEELYECRKSAAELFGTSPDRVVFTSGATHALNMAITGAVQRDGDILISDLEHNAVLRPALASGCKVQIFPSHLHLSGIERTIEILASIDHLADKAAAVVCTAASNICGAVMPISDIGAYCRKRGILFIVDGAQAGGVYDINVKRDCIDVLCLPGHKGLYGPMGCGLMILGEDVTLPPFMYGGSGVDSRSPGMPEFPPERYEAGTLPVPLISGLRQGIGAVISKTPKRIREHETRLAANLKKRLLDMGARIYAPCQGGTIVLFNMGEIPSEKVASHLNDHGIYVRAGLHCAPLAHKTLGSEGAVRVSFGMYNTENDVNEFCRVLGGLKA